MRFHRGTPPVLYHLVHGEKDIGTLSRSDDGWLVLELHGFHTASAAASAAWMAHSGRMAYEAQFAEAATEGRVDGALRFLAAKLRKDGDGEQVQELVTHGVGGALRLCLGEEEIGRLTAAPPRFDVGAPLWSIAVPMGPADTPAVFAMAAARRMWDSVRRTGLWRQMAQWVSPQPPAPAA